MMMDAALCRPFLNDLYNLGIFNDTSTRENVRDNKYLELSLNTMLATSFPSEKSGASFSIESIYLPEECPQRNITAFVFVRAHSAITSTSICQIAVLSIYLFLGNCFSNFFAGQTQNTIKNGRWNKITESTIVRGLQRLGTQPFHVRYCCYC